MKNIISGLLLLLVVLLSLPCIDVFAEETDCNLDLKESVASDDEAVEEKIICKATLDDDFDDSSVIVVFKHNESLNLKEYSKYDFKLDEIKNVDNLTSFQSSDIINTYSNSVDKFVKSDTLIKKSLGVDSALNIKKSKINLAAVKYAKNTIESKFSYFHKILQLHLVNKGKQNVLNTIKKLEKREDVLIAEPNYYAHATNSPNDTKYSKQWAPKNIKLEKAWDITTGNANLLVGVMDSGIDGDHPDLKANLTSTLHKSFVKGDNSPLKDTYGHGTNVAGVIGARGNNSKGIAGVCWKVSLVSLKICINDNATTSSVSNAIDYAVEKNIGILNFSYSSDSNSFKSSLDNYKGMFICSSGNNKLSNGGGQNLDSSKCKDKKIYPSKFTNKNIISVASIDENNKLAADSNYGAKSVDLAAPGVGIYTTNIDDSERYIECLGTSFAAPQVTGVVALIKSKYPTISNEAIKSAILDNVKPTESVCLKVLTDGRLDAYSALQGVPSHTYNVKYICEEYDGGTPMNDSLFIYGIPQALKNNTYKKNGHTFLGWNAYRQSDSKWLYDTNNGSKWYREGEQPSGAKKHYYKNQAKIQHTSSVYDDVVYMVAQWKRHSYTVKFVNDFDNLQSMSNQVVNYGTNKSLRKNTFVRPGYRFIGWYAKRKSDNKCFYENGHDSMWYLEGSQPSGYYKHLFKDEAYISKTSAVDNDIIYMYPQWTASSYSIEYNGNGGYGTKERVTANSFQNITLGANTFTKTGYTFVGWTLIDSEGYWYVKDSGFAHAIDDGTAKRFEDNEIINLIVDDGIELTAYAQWASNSTLVGDVNLDGVINIRDATKIIQYLDGDVEFDNNQRYAADFNQDGYVTEEDATALRQYLINTNS